MPVPRLQDVPAVWAERSKSLAQQKCFGFVSSLLYCLYYLSTPPSHVFWVILNLIYYCNCVSFCVSMKGMAM